MTTIKDVAHKANVSLSTVSKVINHNKRFSKEVEARVWKAVQELQFSPNPTAQSMITGRTNTIGVVILDIANPYFASIVKGASQEAAAHQFTVLLGDADESPEREKHLLEVFAKRSDGIILAGSRQPDAALLELALHKPLVVVGRVPGQPVCSIISNEYEIAFQLTKHLVTTGRKSIAYLAGPPFWTNQQRRQGYLDALEQAQLNSLEVAASTPTLDGGAAVAGQLLLGTQPIDALLAYNDLLALGFMSAAKQLGFSIPEDVAVAGIGDIPYAAQSNPSLTTATVPSLELGRTAMRLLRQQLFGLSLPLEPVVLASRLQVRASSQGFLALEPHI